MKFTKDLIGKCIYATPTGNNSRGNKNKIYTFKVLDVKRRYARLRIYLDNGEEGYEDSYCMKTGASESQARQGYTLNAGFKFYRTKEAIGEKQNRDSIEDKIKCFFSVFGETNLNLDQLYRIEKIIGEIKN